MDSQGLIVKHKSWRVALSSHHGTVSLLLFCLNSDSHCSTNKELFNADRKIRHHLGRKRCATSKKAKRGIAPALPDQDFNRLGIRIDNPILWYLCTSIGMQFHI